MSAAWPQTIAYLQAHTEWLLSGAATLGLIVGSFLNVVILRLPARLEHGWRQQCAELLQQPSTVSEVPPGLVTPPSRCPHCGHRLRAFENIPVLSFVLLRGRCARCREPISWRYPVVELLTAAVTVVVVWTLGLGVVAGGALVLSWCLIALTFIDYDHHILPDAITLPLLWLGLLFNLGGTYTDLSSAILGAAGAYLFLWLVYHAFRLATGKEGMGFGDFKLFAVFGAWLGWQYLPLIILFAALAGAIIGSVSIWLLSRSRSQPIPFGPYLSLAGWIALLWGNQILAAYLQFSHIG